MKLVQNSSLLRQECYINGKWIKADNNKSISVVNPADGQIIGHVPECGADETKLAIQSARIAWDKWRILSALERGKLMKRWAQLIEENKQDLARIMTLEQGKPLNESLGEIEYANSFITWFAEEGRRVYGDIIPSNKQGEHLLILKQPIGVVGAITPWNFPSAMITRKCAPALAAGCTIIIKPASETPFSALALAALAEEAKIPAGVLNVITGKSKEIGKELTTNPSVRKISFTGSTAVGKVLMQQSAGTLKKVSLELGGNAPFIIFDDCDLNAAVKGVMASKFRNTGQTCICANRILVHEKIYEAFTDKLIQAAKTLKIGNGLDPSVQQGPLINEAAIKKINKHIKDAIDKGAKLVLGGKSLNKSQLFFEPTILTLMSKKMLIAREETFGPVAPLFSFSTDEEAIALANDTEFGLAAYFYTKDMQRIWRVAEALEYGMVGINEGIISNEVAPFGGVKESGMGREGSKYGIEEYLEIKYLCMGAQL